jgi:uncharacterized protein
MAKPTGATCNLNCAYCFFLSKESFYPGSNFRMSDEVMESYVRQTIEAHSAPEVIIAWQGGEPTLMGLDFCRRAVEVAKRYRKPDTKVQHTIQTNGILLDREWCEFLRENRFLVGISVDGPRALHDAYRRDKGGHGTFDRVVNAARQSRLQCALRGERREQRTPTGGLSFFPRRVRGALSAIHPDRRAD